MDGLPYGLPLFYRGKICSGVVRELFGGRNGSPWSFPPIKNASPWHTRRNKKRESVAPSKPSPVGERWELFPQYKSGGPLHGLPYGLPFFIWGKFVRVSFGSCSGEKWESWSFPPIKRGSPWHTRRTAPFKFLERSPGSRRRFLAMRAHVAPR